MRHINKHCARCRLRALPMNSQLSNGKALLCLASTLHYNVLSNDIGVDIQIRAEIKHLLSLENGHLCLTVFAKIAILCRDPTSSEPSAWSSFVFFIFFLLLKILYKQPKLQWPISPQENSAGQKIIVARTLFGGFEKFLIFVLASKLDVQFRCKNKHRWFSEHL